MIDKLLPALFLILMLVSWAKPATAAEQVLVLKQQHRVFGPLEVYLSKQAVWVNNPSRKLVFFCSAPSWDALIYSDKRKVIYRRPYSLWIKSGLKTALSFEDNDGMELQHPYKERTIMYAGLKAQVLAYPGSYGAAKQSDYTLSTDVHVHRNLERFMQAMHDVPPAEGIPLRYRRVGASSFGFGLAYNKKFGVQNFMETKSTTRIPFNAKLFQPPTNYKPVTDTQIFLDAKRVDDAYGELMGN